ncbi:MAG: hypothetical protein R3E89_19470, partial [Thiolinea sp.]
FRHDASFVISPLRQVLYTLAQLLLGFGLLAPLMVGLIHELVYVYGLPEHPPLTPLWLIDILQDGIIAFIGLLLGGLLLVMGLPRLLQGLVQEERDYPLYGVHFFLAEWIRLSSNSRFFNDLFGDSSLITRYLRGVGYRLTEVIQTGSNFGMAQRHDHPLLCEVGSRSMVSDGLSLINLRKSNTAFRLVRTRIGADNFLGNQIIFPAAARCEG